MLVPSLTVTFAVNVCVATDPLMLVRFDTQEKLARPDPGPTVTLSSSDPAVHVSDADDVVPELSTTTDQNPLSLVSSTWTLHPVEAQWLVAVVRVAPFTMALTPVCGGGVIAPLPPPQADSNKARLSSPAEHKRVLRTSEPERAKVDP